MNLQEIRVNSYLKLGYFIDYDRRTYPIDFSRIDASLYEKMDEDELVRLGTEKLRQTFREQFVSGAEHVIPLSGGLDSRLILGALLELTEAKNIHTCTFGVPGTYDYDIGCQVGRHMGTRQSALPLNGFSYHEDELMNRAHRMHRQVNVFQCPPLWHMDRLFKGSLIWSGYIGDLVAGSHLPKEPAPTLAKVRANYLQKRSMVSSMKLDRSTIEDLLPHLTGGDEDTSLMTREEHLMFEEAVRKFTAPIVLLDGYTYKTPFINTPWFDFMMSVPRQYREGEYLLIKIAQHMFPDLFGLPTKTSYGAPLGARKEYVLFTRGTNKLRKMVRRKFPSLAYPPMLYDDFDERFRERNDLGEIGRRNLADLAKRGIVDWLNLDDIWHRHTQRLGNYGDAIKALVSLEIVLKAEEAAASSAR